MLALNESELNLIKANLWARGELSWKLHDAQLKIHSHLESITQKLYVINCARQFGKSFLMVLYAIERALQKPNRRIKYATAFLSELTEFIIPAFDTILSDCPADIKPEYKVQGSKYKFPNGSEIKLIGVDKNPDGLRGNTIDYILLDEAGYISGLDYIYKSVIIPATMHRPNARIIMLSTPPLSPEHDFKLYCERAELENAYAKFTIYDNPMLSPDLIQELIKESGGELSSTWRREYLCEFVIDKDRAIITEFKETMVQTPLKNEFYQFFHKYEGMDLGVTNDLTVVLFGYYDFINARLIIEDEWAMNGPEITTEKIFKAVTEIELRLWQTQTPYKRISDSNNPLLINDLAIIHNLHFISTDKESLHGMVNKVKMWVGDNRLQIDPKCKQLIGCLKSGIWDKHRTAFGRDSKVYGHYDALAALVYLIRNIDTYTNPIPTNYKTNEFTHYTPPSTNPKNEILKKIFNV